jgi:hypothetical protein
MVNYVVLVGTLDSPPSRDEISGITYGSIAIPREKRPLFGPEPPGNTYRLHFKSLYMPDGIEFQYGDLVKLEGHLGSASSQPGHYSLHIDRWTRLQCSSEYESPMSY